MVKRPLLYRAKGKPPRPPKPPPKVVHGNKVVMVLMPNGRYRHVLSRTLASLMGNSKGALAIWASGHAHRWTSEEARRAAKKSWKRKGRMSKRLKTRIGRKLARKPRLNRRAIRDAHRLRTMAQTGVYCCGHDWFHEDETTIRRISERAALRRLGYLPRPLKHPINPALVTKVIPLTTRPQKKAVR